MARDSEVATECIRWAAGHGLPVRVLYMLPHLAHLLTPRSSSYIDDALEALIGPAPTPPSGVSGVRFSLDAGNVHE